MILLIWKRGDGMNITPGLRIKQLREKRDWSQLELAKRVGINNSVLSRIEADKRPIEAELLAKFAEVFGVSSDYILGRLPKDKFINHWGQLSPEDQRILDEFMDLSDDDKRYVIELIKRIKKG
jgi:transcriptional regulator with XRE-family HTH domain